MKAHVLTGSKQHISEAVARLPGQVREAIVFVDEEVVDSQPALGSADLFAEMEPFTVRTAGADYSRASIYGRVDGE